MIQQSTRFCESAGLKTQFCTLVLSSFDFVWDFHVMESLCLGTGRHAGQHFVYLIKHVKVAEAVKSSAMNNKLHPP